MGESITPSLLREYKNKKTPVKLGIIGILARIRDNRSVPSLILMLGETNSEIRWQAAIALGELGDVSAVPHLFQALTDPDKFVRYGAAVALAKLGWEAASLQDKARHFAAVQDWAALKFTGPAASDALAAIAHDPDPVIRKKIIRALGELGSAESAPVIITALSDPDREVRWEAVLASGPCGVTLLELPRAVSKRKKNRKNPWIAGFMNFMLPGLGYGYLGKWWGIMIFQIDITLTVWLFRIQGESLTYVLLLPVYLILALHAAWLAARQPDEAP
jgi:HEAT repeat protein